MTKVCKSLTNTMRGVMLSNLTLGCLVLLNDHASAMVVRFFNDTGFTINSIDITFTGDNTATRYPPVGQIYNIPSGPLPTDTKATVPNQLDVDIGDKKISSWKWDRIVVDPVLGKQEIVFSPLLDPFPGPFVITATPIPSALPLFVVGFGVISILGSRRKRKIASCAQASVKVGVP